MLKEMEAILSLPSPLVVGWELVSGSPLQTLHLVWLASKEPEQSSWSFYFHLI